MSTERGSSYVKTTRLGSKWAKATKFCAGAWNLKIKHTESEDLRSLSELIRGLGFVSLNSVMYFMAWELKEESVNKLDAVKRKKLKQYVLTLPPYNQKQNSKLNL